MDQTDIDVGIAGFRKWVEDFIRRQAGDDVPHNSVAKIAFDAVGTMLLRFAEEERESTEQFLRSLKHDQAPDISAFVGSYAHVVGAVSNALTTVIVAALLQDQAEPRLLAWRTALAVTGIKWAHQKGLDIGIKVLIDVLEGVKAGRAPGDG